MALKIFLNTTVFLLLVSTSVTVQPTSAERCLTAPGIASRGPFIGKVIRKMNPCLGRGTLYTVCGTNPMILTPQANKCTQGSKKTFTWRQFNIRPPRPAAKPVSRMRGKPEQTNTNVIRVKQIPQRYHRSDGVRPNNPKTPDVTPTPPTQPKPQGNRKDDAPRESKMPTEPNKIPASKLEKLCHENRSIIFINDTKKFENCSGCVSNGTVTVAASCGEVKGICPAMSALNCIFNLNAAHEKGNVDRLDSSKYADRSSKVYISELGKIVLTDHELDQLKELAESIYDVKAQMNFREKPLIVVVEDVMSNKTTKYVIVKEVGNIMVGMQLIDDVPSATTTTPESSTHPKTDDNTRRQTQQTSTVRFTLPMKNSSWPYQTLEPGSRKSLVDIDHPLIRFEPLPDPQALMMGRTPFVHCLEPSSSAGDFGGSYCITQRPNIFGMAEPTLASVPHFQPVTELPTATLSHNAAQSYQDQHNLYNERFIKREDHTGNWMQFEMLPNAEESKKQVFENIPATNETYNARNWPYWNERSYSSSKNSPESSEHDRILAERFDIVSEPNQFQRCNDIRAQPPRVPNYHHIPFRNLIKRNSRQRIPYSSPLECSPTQLQPERMKPARVLEYLPHIHCAGALSRYLKYPQNDFKRGIASNDNKPISYNDYELRQTCQHAPGNQQYRSMWQNYETPISSPTLPQSSSYCHLYAHRVDPKQTVAHPNLTYNAGVLDRVLSQPK